MISLKIAETERVCELGTNVNLPQRIKVKHNSVKVTIGMHSRMASKLWKDYI